jgi:hypothetical protein
MRKEERKKAGKKGRKKDSIGLFFEEGSDTCKQ